jgi:hypothetical protein
MPVSLIILPERAGEVSVHEEAVLTQALRVVTTYVILSPSCQSGGRHIITIHCDYHQEFEK